MVDALVAGHICLDIFPGFRSKIAFDPGRLIEIGPAMLSTGGVVSNTGQALHKLGVETALCGKVGQDLFGRAILEILERTGVGLSSGMKTSPGEATSYSVVISLSGEDRMFLHAPGCNDTFVADDVSDEALANTKLMHFGYPTLMAKMYADRGKETTALFRRAKTLGATTSLDVSLPDLAGPAAGADWEAILANLLPFTDLFLPSEEEIFFMLDRSGFLAHKGGELAPALIQALARKAIDLGAKIIGVKAGSRGLYLATADHLDGIGRAAPIDAGAWQSVELWAPCFLVNVAGTTGAGDATIAGLLMGLLRGMSPAAAARAATAVGAASCEHPDAITGIPSWDTLEQRIAAGWLTCPE